MNGSPGYIADHRLWSAEQTEAAEYLAAQVAGSELRLIRLVWSDTHGHTRAKSVTPAAFGDILKNGYNVNVATWTLDASGGRVFSSFVEGGGMGLAEMTGSPNLVIVPDPATFRELPWAPGVGWVLCDEYFRDGSPFHFSSRRILRNACALLEADGRQAIVGLEIEWYLNRLADESLADDQVGEPGERGRAPAVTSPEPGFSYHSESNMDRMQPILSQLTDIYGALDLGLRSVENEWGAGQVECTFEAKDALRAADDFLLFRTATRQVCRRAGMLASFMCWPALRGRYPSGWHLHMSLTDTESGRNLFMPDGSGNDAEDARGLLSPFGQRFLAGLLDHAGDGAPFATPTINGYRRFRENSLAPDRATWGFDHRGVMVRLLGGPGDPATRFEHRVGEPSANPYLYIASLIHAGLDGDKRSLEPWPADASPYQADRPMLPKDLPSALSLLDKSTLYRDAFGSRFIDYFLRLKQAEIARFEQAENGQAGGEGAGRVTAWEMDEYFDFF